MYQFIKIISQNHNGQLAKCEKCNLYNLTYNNILFEFTNDEFESFKHFLKTIEPEFCKKTHNSSFNKRNIPINTYQKNLFLVFSSREIQDLKKMLLTPSHQVENFEVLSFDKINYKLQLN